MMLLIRQIVENAMILIKTKYILIILSMFCHYSLMPNLIQKAMRYLVLLFLVLSSASILAQEDAFLQGSVSYVGNQNVYVSFVSTEGLNVGDSLYMMKDNKLKAVLIVSNLSSISSICTPIGQNSFIITNKVLAKKPIDKPIEVIMQQELDAISVNEAAIKSTAKKVDNHELKSRVDGRVSVSSYSNFTDNTADFNPDSVNKISSIHRLRYNVEFNAEHISNSKFSLETNFAFTHLLNDSNERYDGFRIFDLALNYDLSKNSTLTFGRKINANLANVGAVDGLVYEKSIHDFSYGALVGSRPNDSTYGFDPMLLQFGAFLGHRIEKETGGYSQTTFAFFNQTNSLITDRRYIYLQHSNSLMKNLNFFCSFETDLFKLDTLHVGIAPDSTHIIAYNPTSTFDLTGLYASVRYQPWKKLSMSLSYDARNNVYFYETYKNTFNGIFDKMTRKGWKVQATVRPVSNLIWGLSGGYRLSPATPSAAINAHSYLTYTNIPYINTAVTISATALKSYSVNTSMYDISLSRDIIEGKLSADLQYSLVNYNYNDTHNAKTVSSSSIMVFEGLSLMQNIASLSFNWRLTKNLMLSADFEGTLDVDNKYGRMFLNISQRF